MISNIQPRFFFPRSSWQLVSASPIPAISPATAHMKRRSSTLKPHCFSKVSFWGFKLSPWQLGKGPADFPFVPRDQYQETGILNLQIESCWVTGVSRHYHVHPIAMWEIFIAQTNKHIHQHLLLADSYSRRILIANIMFGWLLNLYGQDQLIPYSKESPGSRFQKPCQTVQPSIICCENQNLVIFILRAGSAIQMTPVKYVKFIEIPGPSGTQVNLLYWLPGVHESDCDLDESDHARDY